MKNEGADDSWMAAEWEDSPLACLHGDGDEEVMVTNAECLIVLRFLLSTSLINGAIHPNNESFCIWMASQPEASSLPSYINFAFTLFCAFEKWDGSISVVYS